MTRTRKGPLHNLIDKLLLRPKIYQLASDVGALSVTVEALAAATLDRDTYAAVTRGGRSSPARRSIAQFAEREPESVQTVVIDQADRILDRLAQVNIDLEVHSERLNNRLRSLDHLREHAKKAAERSTDQTQQMEQMMATLNTLSSRLESLEVAFKEMNSASMRGL